MNCLNQRLSSNKIEVVIRIKNKDNDILWYDFYNQIQNYLYYHNKQFYNFYKKIKL